MGGISGDDVVGILAGEEKIASVVYGNADRRGFETVQDVVVELTKVLPGRIYDLGHDLHAIDVAEVVLGHAA